jgi:malonyl-CoA O-methyltransferase
MNAEKRNPAGRPQAGAVRRAFDAAAGSYDEHAVLQRTVCDRLLERIDLTTVTPRTVLDIGAGTGRATAAMARRWRRADILPIDLSERMLGIARRRRPWFSRVQPLCADMSSLPVAARSVDLIFSSLGLQWVGEPDAAFGEFRRVLRPRGLLLFTSFGPDTLRELRAAWSEVDGYSHVNDFLDMHDIGDALVRAGFAEPVMDVEHFTLTYDSLPELMRDIKRIGAHNVTEGRPRGLTGRQRMRKLTAAYEKFRAGGRLPATYEVVYGTAWAPATGEGQVMARGGGVGIDELRRSLGERKKGRKG